MSQEISLTKNNIHYPRWNIGIVGSNTSRVFLCCAVYVEALRRADPLSKVSYMQKNV